MEEGWTQTGVASWYGGQFHGRVTASGEIYDREGLTAAHRTLPFGTWVRVLRLDNGWSTLVRITDRGPFVEGRIIDLSRAAARRLGMLAPGTARVRLRVVSPGSRASCRLVQVGAFDRRGNALAVRDSLRRQGVPVRLQTVPGGTHRVLLGPYPGEGPAERAAERHGGFLRPCAGPDG